MIHLHHFGIDVSKNWIDVALYSKAMKTHRFDNNTAGFEQLSSVFGDKLLNSLTVFEATGGYENALIDYFLHHNYAFHRASGYIARRFSDSLGKMAKTDAIDACNLARFSFERGDNLLIFTESMAKSRELAALSNHRDDLVAARVQQTNRLQQAESDFIKASIERLIKLLNDEIAEIMQKIDDYIASDAQLSIKSTILNDIKGIGAVTAAVLLAHLPELGMDDRRKISALAGVAPKNKESGKRVGFSHVIGGRKTVRTALFRAVLSAARYNEQIKPFYDRLIANGKSKMTALTACARKLVVIANAKIRDALKLAKTPILKEIMP
jgi:transposase